METLFISGYPDLVISEHGLKGSGANFLRKPFTQVKLINKVAEILKPDPPSQPGKQWRLIFSIIDLSVVFITGYPDRAIGKKAYR